MHLNCPHCHNPIEIVDDGSAESSCPSCGSSIDLKSARANKTKTWDGKGPIAMRVGRRVAEERVEAVEDIVGDGVLKLLRLGMHGGPVHLEDVDEKGFHEAVLAEDVERDAPAGVGQAHAVAGLVLDEALGGEGLYHRGDGAGHDGERGRERAHRHEFHGVIREQQQMLEVVFDRAGGHGRN